MARIRAEQNPRLAPLAAAVVYGKLGALLAVNGFDPAPHRRAVPYPGMAPSQNEVLTAYAQERQPIVPDRTVTARSMRVIADRGRHKLGVRTLEHAVYRMLILQVMQPEASDYSLDFPDAPLPRSESIASVALQAYGLSQDQVADIIGVSISHVPNIMRVTRTYLAIFRPGKPPLKTTRGSIYVAASLGLLDTAPDLTLSRPDILHGQLRTLTDPHHDFVGMHPNSQLGKLTAAFQSTDARNNRWAAERAQAYVSGRITPQPEAAIGES